MFRGKRPLLVHLVYVEDSSDNADWMVMGAAIIAEADFSIIEGWLAKTIAEHVPEALRSSFEFHASAMYNAKPPFEKLSKGVAKELIARVITVMAEDRDNPDNQNYFVYGAVNMRQLRGGYFSTSRPQDVAFRACLEGVEAWFKSQPERKHMGLLICDDSTNAQLKKDLQQTYRAKRGVMSGFGGDYAASLASYIHDDMYFGDSSHSVGLQVADICSYVVLRHLQGLQDTEDLYRALEPQIFFSRVLPPP